MPLKFRKEAGTCKLGGNGRSRVELGGVLEGRIQRREAAHLSRGRADREGEKGRGNTESIGTHAALLVFHPPIIPAGTGIIALQSARSLRGWDPELGPSPGVP